MATVLVVVGVLVVAIVVLGVVFFLGMRAKSPLVQGLVRRMNRRFMNPRQLRTAGTPGAYASIVRHVGRRSGTAYETPVVPFPIEGGFVVALPYGTRPDWLQNVLAAGTAILVNEGTTYRLDDPEVVPTDGIRDALPAKEQRDLARFRVDRALRARATPIDAATGSQEGPSPR